MTESIETPSGKQAADENFPVGSFLIRPALRRHVHIFYRFARMGDDIADNPDLSPDDKVARLKRMADVVQHADATGDIEVPSAARMRESLHETGITPQHCLDLLQAFTQDALKTRYRDWDDLLAYCMLSAAPVGRQLLDLHGEGQSCREASDALCNALQVVNHLQDCGDDYRQLDRVYLPTAAMERAGVSVSDLSAPHLSPGMRQVLDETITPLRGLLATCADLVLAVDDTRIALECEIIRTMCARLTERLSREDPLASRVGLSKPTAAGLTLIALTRGLWRRRSL